MRLECTLPWPAFQKKKPIFDFEFPKEFFFAIFPLLTLPMK